MSTIDEVMLASLGFCDGDPEKVKAEMGRPDGILYFNGNHQQWSAFITRGAHQHTFIVDEEPTHAHSTRLLDGKYLLA